MWRNKALFLILVAAFDSLADEPLLLTAEVASANIQTITSPRTKNWNSQLLFLAPNGKKVRRGDVVVVFDGASVESELRRSKQELELEKRKLVRTRMTNAEALLEAEHALTQARLTLNRSRIDGAIPESEVGAFTHAENQLEWERAATEVRKAENALNTAQLREQSETAKHQVSIAGIEADILDYQAQLKKLKVTALFSGTALHQRHPWEHHGIKEGMSVNPGWKVLRIQNDNNFELHTYVLESEANLVRHAKQVSVVFDIAPETSYPATIASVGSQGEERTQWSEGLYHRVIVNLKENPPFKFKAGMSARVEIPREGS